MESTVDKILDEFTNVASLLLRDEGIDDVASSVRYANAIEAWEASELDELIDHLEEQATHLITPMMSWPRAILLTIWDDVRKCITRRRLR